MSLFHRQGAAFDTSEGVQKVAQLVWDTDTLSWVRWDGAISGVSVGDITAVPPTLTKRWDFASDTVLYIGEAAPGALESDAVWRIRRLNFDVNGDPTQVLFAGAGLANQVWSNRALLSYS